MDLSFLAETWLALLAGLPATLRLAAGAIGCGFALALGLAAMRLSGSLALDVPARLFVFVFRGTPLLVQIFLVYYGLGQFRPTLQAWGLWGFFREPFWCALTALSLNTAAYSCEIVRGAVLAVPHGQLEAARACGMSRALALRRIVAPIALRAGLPAYANEMISMVKATALASVITLVEVTFIAQKLISQTFRAVEVFVAAGSIYLLLVLLLTRGVNLLERRLSPHLRAPPAEPASAEAAHA